MNEPATPRADRNLIRIRGARTHNLCDIDVDVPRNCLVVVTGVSGSGKSALVFDTLFAESRRRFLDSLSPQTRGLMSGPERPDVDSVEGLPPAIAVDQRTRSFSRRSTLGTLTEIHDFLRVLYAGAGQAHCPTCDREVRCQSVEAIVRRVLSLRERRKVMILAPLVRGRRGQHRRTFDHIVKAGFVRARVNGEIVDAAEPPDLVASRYHCIEAVVDRIIVKEGIESRLRESIDLAIREAAGTCLISCDEDGQWSDHLYSTVFSCPECATSFPPLEARCFSFNSPYGACAECGGMGVTAAVDSPDGYEDNPDAETECPACAGTRLAPFPGAVRVGGLRLAEFNNLSIDAAAEWAAEVTAADLQTEAREVIAQTLPDVVSRLGYLRRVGLGYLALSRSARSLSGGEFQRARLARCLGSGLTGACYVLDEPTVGLHSSDTQRLIAAMTELRDQGNSVIVVEHDREVLAAADHVIDVGPGAGRDGGMIVAQGPGSVIHAADSPTGRWLRGELSLPEMPTEPAGTEAIRVSGASRNNLRDVSCVLPHGAMTCVVGVSGSGKSSLIIDTLGPLAKAAATGNALPPALCQTVSGLDVFERVLECDARPLGKSARANAATYSGIWKDIRSLYAKTRDARIRGFGSRRFSFNAKEGRCDECSGQGVRRVQMKLMPDVFVVCRVCRGNRFNRATLAVRFNGKTVAEVLAMRIDEAADHFRNFDRIHRMLATFCDIGLGYLGLGQPSHTLSGGEAQRVRLATRLGETTRGASLFILDEPTSGLHAQDVHRLIGVLRHLVGQGHTVVAIEHNTDLIAAADHLIQLGPGAGDRGGRVL